MKYAVLMQMKGSSMLLVLAALALALASAISANATFPGKNGQIVFIQRGSVYKMNSDGTGVQPLTSGASACCAAWSPDGKVLVFSVRVNGNYQLWIMNADGTNQHQLLNDPGYNDVVPSYSPDGSQIVFSRCNPNPCAIYRFQADGSQLTSITPFNSDHDIVDYGPAYSPDGSTIAFYSDYRDGLLAAIYLMSAHGKNIHSLTPPRLGANEADWSPDGTKIAFSTNDLNCGFGSCFVLSSEIWLITVGNDPDTTRLTSNNKHWHGINTVPHDFAPSWSPQGDAIVFERDSPNRSTSAIYVMDPNGNNETLIEQGGTFPRWGPAAAR